MCNIAIIAALYNGGHSNLRYQESGTMENRRSGHTRVSNQGEDHYLMQYPRRHRTASASSLRSHFQVTFGRVILTTTAKVRRRLHHAGLRARRLLRVLSRRREARFQ